jgi:sRNA-binding carbon storage regulator CsrA
MEEGEMKNRISLTVMLVLMFFLPLFLIISHSHGGDVCIPEVWAPTDCDVRVYKIKKGLKIAVSAPKKVKRFQLEISHELPDMNGDFNSKKFSKMSNPDIKMWTVETQNLSPDTLYYYVLKVEDKKGCKSHKVGAHWTNVRNFKLHISKIHVYDDGDTGVKGNGECEFYTYANSILMVKVGSYHDSWVSSGDTVTVNKGNTLKDIGQGNVTIKIKGRECDEASGFILDQETTWDTAQKTITLDLGEFEKEDPAVKDFEVRAQGNVLDFKTYCTGTVYYTKGENKFVPNVSHLQPQKPVIAPKPIGDSEKMKKNPAWAVYQPPSPVIDYPIGRRIWHDVPINIHCFSEKGKPPIVKLSVEFQRFIKSCGDGNNPNCWVSEILHPQAQNIPGDSVSATIKYDKFTHKGGWRLRARAYPKSGIPSKWTAWRGFQVEE